MQGKQREHKKCDGHKEHDDGSGCCGKQQPMQQFMKTSLLLLLAEQTGHGYSLLSQLKDFGFDDINVSTLYRIMRKMEERSWVISSWERGDKGPQRRVYSITQSGRAALDEWIGIFTTRIGNIEMLLTKYSELTK